MLKREGLSSTGGSTLRIAGTSAYRGVRRSGLGPLLRVEDSSVPHRGALKEGAGEGGGGADDCAEAEGIEKRRC